MLLRREQIDQRPTQVGGCLARDLRVMVWARASYDGGTDWGGLGDAEVSRLARDLRVMVWARASYDGGTDWGGLGDVEVKRVGVRSLGTLAIPLPVPGFAVVRPASV